MAALNPPRKDAPLTQFASAVSPPGALLTVKGSVLANWGNLAAAFGQTWPTQDRQTRILTQYFVRAVR